MLNSLAAGYCAMRALSVVSMLLTTVDQTVQVHGMAYGDPDVETAEQQHMNSETVCVLAETMRRHIVTILPSCIPH